MFQGLLQVQHDSNLSRLYGSAGKFSFCTIVGVDSGCEKPCQGIPNFKSDFVPQINDFGSAMNTVILNLHKP